MLLISVQEVSKQLASEARNAGYRGAVTKSGGDEVLKGIEALLRHDMFFYSDDGSSHGKRSAEASRNSRLLADTRHRNQAFGWTDLQTLFQTSERRCVASNVTA